MHALKLTAIIYVLLAAAFSTAYGQEMYDINSTEVKEIAGYLSMEGHSEHDLATCSTKQRYYEEIAEMLNDGYTKEEILQDYEAMYGEQGFREPNKSGFSILAWTIPILMLGAGSTAFILRIKNQMNNQRREKEPLPAERNAGENTEDEVIRAIIEEEKRKHF
jgi:cytochrome c-type biogenesis protein CcmH